MTKWRSCTKLAREGWVPVEFEDIKAGDQVRIFEADGTLVIEVIASTDAVSCNPLGNYYIGAMTFIYRKDKD